MASSLSPFPFLPPSAHALMSTLATPDAGTLPLTAHPTLRAGQERVALVAGVHGLGGRAADAIKLTSLENQPRESIT